VSCQFHAPSVLSPVGITHITHCMVGWFVPQNQCGHYGEDKCLFTISGNWTDIPRFTACVLTFVLTGLSGLLQNITECDKFISLTFVGRRKPFCQHQIILCVGLSPLFCKKVGDPQKAPQSYRRSKKKNRFQRNFGLYYRWPIWAIIIFAIAQIGHLQQGEKSIICFSCNFFFLGGGGSVSFVQNGGTINILKANKMIMTIIAEIHLSFTNKLTGVHAWMSIAASTFADTILFCHFDYSLRSSTV
jgi:hypothetical protein